MSKTAKNTTKEYTINKVYGKGNIFVFFVLFIFKKWHHMNKLVFKRLERQKCMNIW